MKRLRKVAFDRSFYHSTTYENLIKITETGMLLPNEVMGAGPNTNRSNYEGFTFWATDMTTAFDYIRLHLEPGPSGLMVIIEAQLPLDSLLPDDDDCPNCTTWEESAKRINQVKVLGPITDNYLKGVTIIKYDGRYVDLLYGGPFGRWREAIMDWFGTLDITADEIGNDQYALNGILSDVEENPESFFPSLNVVGGFAVNNTLTDVMAAFNEFANQLRARDDAGFDAFELYVAYMASRDSHYGNLPNLLNGEITGFITNGNVQFVLPLIKNVKAYLNPGGVFFKCLDADHVIEFKATTNDVIKGIAPNVINVRRVFEDVLNYEVYTQDEFYRYDLNQLLDRIESDNDTRSIASMGSGRLRYGRRK